ncbi:MAG: DUF1552 domain-containing protein [Bryobacteraceae bacterium]
MFLARKHISRRTLLRGLGAAIALPALDSMTPAFAGSSGGKAPARMAFVYAPNGIVMRQWTPAVGGDFPLVDPLPRSFPRILKPLEGLRNDIQVLSGLTQDGGRAHKDGPGDHARAAASFLTGAHPHKTAGADIYNGPSVDQIAAQRLGSATKFASLELTLEAGGQAGSCDSGYSCAYTNNISWRTPTNPMPPEGDPRQLFERLFAGYDTSETAPARALRLRQEKSILDQVMEDTRRLQGGLGPTDRRKLDEYLEAVRAIEIRIAGAEKSAAQQAPSIERPDGVPAEFHEYARLMFDMLFVAFQTDTTRIATLMLGREGSTRTYREIDVPDAHHPITHHQHKADLIEKITKINTYHVEQFAYFLNRLRETPDGDGTLLDRSMIIYGSGISDGNAHWHHNLPVLLAGRGNGALQPGRHVLYPKETPMANLYLSMLDGFGVKVDTLGDGKRPLPL